MPVSIQVRGTKTDKLPRLLEEENLMLLRQVLRGQFSLINPRVDLLFESIETAPQRTWE